MPSHGQRGYSVTSLGWEETGRSQQSQLQVSGVCAFCPPYSEKEALSNRAIAQRGAGGPRAGLQISCTESGSRKESAVTTATPRASALPLTPEKPQAWAGCGRKGGPKRQSFLNMQQEKIRKGWGPHKGFGNLHGPLSPLLSDAPQS